MNKNKKAYLLNMYDREIKNLENKRQIILKSKILKKKQFVKSLRFNSIFGIIATVVLSILGIFYQKELVFYLYSLIEGIFITGLITTADYNNKIKYIKELKNKYKNNLIDEEIGKLEEQKNKLNINNYSYSPITYKNKKARDTKILVKVK